MINACNSNGEYIQYSPQYNLPTRYGSRATIKYEKPTPELYSNHKLLVLKNTYVTGGPGVQGFNATSQIQYQLKKDSVIQNNRIFKVPCRFQQFIELIQLLLDEGKSIQNILNFLSVKYNIPNLLSNTNNNYQLKNFYKYSYVNTNAPKVDSNTVSNSAPFRIGKSLADVNLQPIINDIVVKPPSFITAQYASSIFVSTNNGKSVTNQIKDLLPGGEASFFGALLFNNFYLENPNKFNVYGFVVPQNITQKQSYGYIVDSTKYNIPGLSGLIYIPIQTYASLITFKQYPLGMAFMVYFNAKTLLNENITQCRFKKYIPFINNQVIDTVSYE
jgi:hypothetical protein